MDLAGLGWDPRMCNSKKLLEHATKIDCKVPPEVYYTIFRKGGPGIAPPPTGPAVTQYLSTGPSSRTQHPFVDTQIQGRASPSQKMHKTKHSLTHTLQTTSRFFITLNTIWTLCKQLPGSAKLKFCFLELSGVFSPDIFNPQLVESMDWEPVDKESQLYGRISCSVSWFSTSWAITLSYAINSNDLK